MTTPARAQELIGQLQRAIDAGDTALTLFLIDTIERENVTPFVKIGDAPIRSGLDILYALRDEAGNDDAGENPSDATAKYPPGTMPKKGAGTTATPTNSAEATAARDNLLALFDLVEQAEDTAETALQEFDDAELWAQLTDADGNAFASLADFVEADQPYGLGLDPSTLEPLDEADDPSAPRAFGDDFVTRERPSGIGWGATADTEWEDVAPPPEGIEGRLVRAGR